MSMADTGFARFIATGAGRTLRAVVGLALIAWGGMGWGTTTALVEVVVGVVFVFVGVFDLCLITGLFGGVWTGRRLRGRAAQRQ